MLEEEKLRFEIKAKKLAQDQGGEQFNQGFFQTTDGTPLLPFLVGGELYEYCLQFKT